MIKKQQKWIALLVTLTFMWLLQVSTMPMAAANTAEQASSASAEQGPDYVEAVGHKAAPAKKKSILPIILIGVGVVALTTVLLLVVLKPKYDITGEWVVTYGTGSVDTFTFAGTKESGNYTTSKELAKGTYTVDGKNVSIKWTGWTGGWHIIVYSWDFIGKFTSKTTMSGTHSGAGVLGLFSGTWTAVKK